MNNPLAGRFNACRMMIWDRAFIIHMREVHGSHAPMYLSLLK
ncbi:hypothetical protein ABIE78_001086 [Sinorhizobium fredii]